MSIPVEVGLISGQTAVVQAALDETVATLKRRAQICTRGRGRAAPGLIWMRPGRMFAGRESQGAEWRLPDLVAQDGSSSSLFPCFRLPFVTMDPS